MTPEQIGAVFSGLSGLLAGIGGIVLAVLARRRKGGDVEAYESWRIKVRAYIAKLREMLADRGVETEDPPPFPERVE